MAITLGTFTQSPAGFTGSLKTLNVTAALTIVPEPGRQIERRDLCEPQTGRPRIWRELAALPPRQARAPGRGRRHPHRAVGTARPLTTMPRRDHHGGAYAGHNRTAAAFRWGMVSLPHENLAAAGEALIGHELAAPSFTHRIRLPAPLLLRLLKPHEAAVHLAKTAPDLLARPEVAQAMEQGLLHAMVSCVSGAAAAETRDARHRHAVVMRRLENVLEANLDRTLYLLELCAATGVSDRAPCACCQEYLGMSPTHYLWHAPHAPGSPRLARSRSDGDDPDRDGLWLLGIGSLLGRVSVVVREVAIGVVAPAARGPCVVKKPRFALASSGICIGSRVTAYLPCAPVTLPVGIVVIQTAVLVRRGCREADAPKRHRHLHRPRRVPRRPAAGADRSPRCGKRRVRRSRNLVNPASPSPAAQRGGPAAHRVSLAATRTGLCRFCGARVRRSIGAARRCNRPRSYSQPRSPVSPPYDRSFELEPDRAFPRGSRKIRRPPRRCSHERSGAPRYRARTH